MKKFNLNPTLEYVMNRIFSMLVALLFASLSILAQQNDLLPYDNLVVDAVPPIPQSIVQGVGRYTEFRSASLSSWHPTRHEMLISTRFADVPQIHQVAFPGGARKQLTFFTDRVGGASYNPKRDDYFVFSKDAGGGEWFQNYRYDVATGDITLLTDGASRNSLGVWSKDGTMMAYTSTRRNKTDVDVYSINPADPKTDKLLTQVEGGGWSPLDWSPDGKKILLMEFISANESYLWMIDVASGVKSILTPKDVKEQILRGGAEFSHDGKGIYITSDRNSEFQRLAYVDLATLNHTILTENINWDVESFRLSPDGKIIAFITNEDGIGVLHLLSTETKKEIPVPKLPPGLISGIRWHEDGSLLGFNMSSARSATDIYSLNITTGSVERWTYSETGGLNVDNFSEPTLVKWKSFDGKMISGFQYLPPKKSDAKYPVMIVIHGGPEGQSRPGFLGRTNYYLNELGVALIYPNIRGSTGYGKTFLKLDNGFKREDSYKDLGALLDWIATQPHLDSKKIMVTGGSYGGHSTLAVATMYSNKIACSLPVVGMSNLVTFLERTESYRRDLRRVEYGDEREPKMRAFLEKIAPLNNASKITKPMFVIQGKNDPRVPFTESEQIVTTVKTNKTPIWYLMANDEGHGFAKKKNQDYQFYSTVLFMKKFLLSTEKEQAP